MNAVGGDRNSRDRGTRDLARLDKRKNLPRRLIEEDDGKVLRRFHHLNKVFGERAYGT